MVHLLTAWKIVLQLGKNGFNGRESAGDNGAQIQEVRGTGPYAPCARYAHAL